MKNVVFVAPYFGPTMLHCLRAFAGLEETKLGIISHQPAEHIPTDLRPRISGHYKIDDAMSADQLTAATRSFIKEWGHVDRLEGYLEQLQVTLGMVRDRLGIDGLGAREALNFRDKNRMKSVLASANLPVARQALIHGAEDAFTFARQVGYPLVLKPQAGVGSRDTMRASDDEGLAAALNQLLPSPKQPIQAEEFIHGAEGSFETVFIDGEPVWSSSTYYLPGPLQVIENPWMQYCVLLPREERTARTDAFAPINHASLQQLGLRDGISHMEWFQTASKGSIVSEVGARPPGANIMPLNSAAHDVDMWSKWARLVVHREWDMPARKYAVGSAFIRGQGRGGVIRRISGLPETQKLIEGMVWAHKLPSVGQLRSSHYEGDGWIIVRHEETQRVVEALRAIMTTLRVELG